MENEEFASIDLDVTPELQDKLVEAYVITTMRPESISVFEADRAAGDSIEVALYHAVFNEMVIRVLIDQIERAKTTETPAD